MKNKNNMIISIDAEEPFVKIQYSFMIKKKSSPESGHRGNLPQHNKGHIWQSHWNITVNGEKLKAFPLRSGIRQGCPLLPLLFNIALEIPIMAIREEKQDMEYKLGKKK